MTATTTAPPPVRPPASRAYPGPPRREIPGMMIRMMQNRLTVMEDIAARFGDVVRIPLGPKKLHVFNHPDYAKHVLADNPTNYHKGIGLVHARRVIGDGLLTSEGDKWRQQRKTIQPVFQVKRIARQFSAIAEEAELLVERLKARKDAGPVDMREEMTSLTLGVLGRTLMDADLGAFESIGDDFHAVQDQAMFEMMTLSTVPKWVPLPKQRRFRKARASLDRVVATLAAERVKHPTAESDDIVSRLVESTKHETDRTVAQNRMRDELVTLLLAGHETTASTLSWAFHLLDKHPQVWERLHAEAVDALSGGDADYGTLAKLPYTSMIIEEVIRLYPPVWILPRIAQQDDEIGGYHVPAGADVLICPYLLHRHPGLWDQPERFDPDRFDPANSARRNRYSYIPFGAGPRFCVGNNLGLMEATIVLATVARDLKLTTVPGYKVVGEPMLTLRIRGGLPMTIREAA
jgi:enediyne biosynthesis protein E7